MVSQLRAAAAAGSNRPQPEARLIRVKVTSSITFTAPGWGASDDLAAQPGRG
jgi:hypothetical protein